MLLVGSDDGLYRTTGPESSETAATERVLDSGRVLRVRTFDGFDGVFAAALTGLYHSRDGEEWTSLDVPGEEVYAVGASPDGERVYAGTRPAHVYVARPDGSDALDGTLEWRDLDGFRRLAERDGWGVPRQDGVPQVRALRVPDDSPARVVAGIEVGGVYVSDDAGDTWSDRSIDGFDAPHTGDIHHVALADSETMIAGIGSGLYRTDDAGRTWDRLDGDYRQRYVRETFVHDGTVFAGASPAPSSRWAEDPDHALFECHDGRTHAVESPTPEEVAVGWCECDGDVLAATDRGSLLGRESDGWEVVGSVPVPESINGRCIPLAWYEP